jgi:hypothetical protein
VAHYSLDDASWLALRTQAHNTERLYPRAHALLPFWFFLAKVHARGGAVPTRAYADYIQFVYPSSGVWWATILMGILADVPTGSSCDITPSHDEGLSPCHTSGIE